MNNNDQHKEKSLRKLLRTIIKENLNSVSEMLHECTVAAVRLKDGIVLAKNRDRGYTAKMNVIHEIVDGVEMVYWHDINTDWSEGMNEYGIGIVNASLLVKDDEKESDKIKEKQEDEEDNYDEKEGGEKEIKNDETEVEKKATDGAKIREALKQKKLFDAIKSVVSFVGEDDKNVGIKGNTIVAQKDNVYIVEETSQDSPIINKFNKDEKVMVRTNHGIFHKNVGYTKGIKKKSSHMRMDVAEVNLEDAQTDQDVIDTLKTQYTKNKFLNPYRLNNKFNMQTVGQIMMNLNKKEVTIRMDEEFGVFEGIENRLPEGYKAKIKIKIEK
jgi:hypothetical protein